MAEFPQVTSGCCVLTVCICLAATAAQWHQKGLPLAINGVLAPNAYLQGEYGDRIETPDASHAPNDIPGMGDEQAPVSNSEPAEKPYMEALYGVSRHVSHPDREGAISVAEAAPKNEEAPAQDPHGDPALCALCHTSAVGGRDALLFDGNVSQLCQSCHDGRLAAGEAHPVGLAPSDAISERMGADFPLEDGVLTCLSCHNVAWGCKAGQPTTAPNPNFLRGADVSHPLTFCFRCHIRENYRPFNAHDQLEDGKMKADVCIWCHISVPDVDKRLKEGAPYALRSDSFGVCRNCHAVTKGHPTEGSHMHAIPPAEMMWYMSAHEMRPRMRMPFDQLLECVRAAKRTPRAIPLDENGSITCYTCHNPHEKGLLPN